MIRFSKEKVLLLHRIMAQATGGRPRVLYKLK